VIRAAAILVVLHGVLAGEALAQGTSPGKRTTMAGVYTEAQAARGRDTFASLCTGCHTVASHTGPAFMNNWRGYPLSELFGYMSAQMPKADPGSLSPVQYVQLIAYILKLNGMPAGPSELPVDTRVLEKITIDTMSAGGPRGSGAPARVR
jgi:mono/diheme cytochrome c family protein